VTDSITEIFFFSEKIVNIPRIGKVTECRTAHTIKDVIGFSRKVWVMFFSFSIFLNSLNAGRNDIIAEVIPPDKHKIIYHSTNLFPFSTVR
jgi:hypothetical protein